MRLPPFIDDLQANRPLGGQMHLGRSETEIFSDDVDRLLGWIACHRPQHKQDEKLPRDVCIEVSAMTGHNGLRWRPFNGSRYNAHP